MSDVELLRFLATTMGACWIFMFMLRFLVLSDLLEKLEEIRKELKELRSNKE